VGDRRRARVLAQGTGPARSSRTCFRRTNAIARLSRCAMRRCVFFDLNREGSACVFPASDKSKQLWSADRCVLYVLQVARPRLPPRLLSSLGRKLASVRIHGMVTRVNISLIVLSVLSAASATVLNVLHLLAAR
jgi:hypothetical protein